MVKRTVKIQLFDEVSDDASLEDLVSRAIKSACSDHNHFDIYVTESDDERSDLLRKSNMSNYSNSSSLLDIPNSRFHKASDYSDIL